MIKKLLLPLFTVFLLGCTDQTASIFQDEPEGSITNFEDNIHGTYASTYRPLESENIVIEMRLFLMGMEINFKILMCIFLMEKFRLLA